MKIEKENEEGVTPIGLKDGNIRAAGMEPLCTHMVDRLSNVPELI